MDILEKLESFMDSLQLPTTQGPPGGMPEQCGRLIGGKPSHS